MAARLLGMPRKPPGASYTSMQTLSRAPTHNQQAQMLQARVNMAVPTTITTTPISTPGYALTGQPAPAPATTAWGAHTGGGVIAAATQPDFHRYPNSIRTNEHMMGAIFAGLAAVAAVAFVSYKFVAGIKDTLTNQNPNPDISGRSYAGGRIRDDVSAFTAEMRIISVLFYGAVLVFVVGSLVSMATFVPEPYRDTATRAYSVAYILLFGITIGAGLNGMGSYAVVGAVFILLGGARYAGMFKDFSWSKAVDEARALGDKTKEQIKPVLETFREGVRQAKEALLADQDQDQDGGDDDDDDAPPARRHSI